MFLALAAITTVQAQSGAYFNAVTNLNPVFYLPLNETVAPLASTPAAINQGILGTVDNGTYTHGAFPGVPGALTGDPDTGGLFTGASGSSPHMSAAYDPAYALITNFTVEIWVNSPTNDPGEDCIINCVDPASPRAGWLIYTDATAVGTFNFRTYYQNGTSTAENYNIPVPGGHILSNTWYHLVVTFNAVTATAQGYVNGQPVASAGTTSHIYIGSTAGKFTVGARSDSSFSFPGYLDEAAFYSNLLSASDIAAHYAAGIGGVPGAYYTAVTNDHPLLYFRMDEGAAPVANNYGTLGALANGYYEAGTTPGVAGPPVQGFGPNNFAVQFTGGQATDGGPTVPIVVANNLSVGTTSNNPITLAAWIQVPSDPTFFSTIMGKGDQSYRFDVDNPGAAPHFNAGNFGDVTGSANMGDDLWHFWVGTWDGTNAQKIFIDTVLAASGTGDLGNNGNANPFLIGSAPDYGNRNFIGSICQVAVFPSALTTNQINALYSASGVPPAITVNPPPSVVANAGTAATLGPVIASGSAPINFTWYSGTPGVGTPVQLSDGGRFSGTHTATLVINPAQAGDAGPYFAVAANAFSPAANSSVSELTVPTAVSAHVYAGASPTFSAGAGGSSYQWSTNGHAVAGATTSTFTLASPINGETVSALIDGSFSSATYTVTIEPAPTDPYPLAVLADGPIAYFRLDEPDNAAGNQGATAYDFISGNNGVYSNTTLAVPGYPELAGPGGINPDTAAEFGTFATANSFAGFIQALDFSLAPSNSPAYAPAEFSVEAWVQGNAGQHNSGIVSKGFGLADGNTGQGFFEQFSLQNSDVGSSGSRYDFIVRDALGNAASAETTSGIINGSWQHIVGVCDQSNGIVRIYVNGVQLATGPLATTNGIMSTPVPLSIGSKQAASTAGNYNAQWVGSVDEVAIYPKALTSNEVLTHYFAAGIPPIITVQPTNVPSIGAGGVTNAPLGTSVTLTTLGFGSPTLHYQWYDYNFGGAPIAVQSDPGVQSTGATTPTLTLKNVSTIAAGGSANTIGSGVFYCTVYNTYGTTNCATVYFTIVSGPPIISPDLPPTTYALVGQSAVFSAGASGTFPQTNGWYFNNGTTTVQLQNAGRYTITAGTSPTLTIASVTTADQGTYQLFTTNSVGYSQSTPSALVVELEPGFNDNGNGWTLNNTAGETSFPSISGGVLTLTQNIGGQANSFFFDTPVYCGAFEASFTFQDVTTNGADGFTFCLQNDPAGAAALGQGGGEIGYGGAETATLPYITNSVAIGFDIYNGHQIGCEFLTGGNQNYRYGPVTPVNLTGGDMINIVIHYDGNNLGLTFTDPTASTAYHTNYVIGPVSPYLGGNTALIGFTGATGGVEAQMNISNFTYTPLPIMSAAISGNNAVITWPTAIGGYVLQSTHAIPAGQTGPGAWTTVPSSSYSIVNGNYQLTVPTSNGTTYYQLFLP
jgi:hypothetical protein